MHFSRSPLPHRLSRRQFFLGALALLSLLAGAPVRATEPRPVRLLTVGNSFTNDATRHLPELAQAGGKKLILLKANLGGASFEEHVKQLTEHEANRTAPLPRGYKDANYAPLKDRADGFSLRAALAAEPWDYITIQQQSEKSFHAETYQPYADLLIAYLRTLAPKAEILIFQTWAYREDYPDFKDGLDQAKMFNGLRDAYRQLADRYGLRIIPVGAAFQAARATPRWHFTPDRNFDFAHPAPGALPNQAGSLNVGWRWTKAGKKKGQEKESAEKLTLDHKHANLDGQYLGAAVLYEVIFADDVRPVANAPQGLSAADAAQLRALAHETVATTRR